MSDPSEVIDPVARLRALLTPFWEHIKRNRLAPLAIAREASVDELLEEMRREEWNGLALEAGRCVETAILISWAVEDARPVSGLFRDKGIPSGWSDHSMTMIGDRLVDFTQAQFDGRPQFSVHAIDGVDVCVQTTRRINSAKAPEDALFVTLLNPPNPVGKRSTVEAWVRRNPGVLEQIRGAVSEILNDRDQPSVTDAGPGI